MSPGGQEARIGVASHVRRLEIKGSVEDGRAKCGVHLGTVVLAIVPGKPTFEYLTNHFPHMKKVFKVIGVLLLLVILVFGGVIVYVTKALPDIPVQQDLRVEVTPARVERGEYLANHVCVCMDCHSERDWSRFSAPPSAGTKGAGGDKFDQSMEFPGEFYARNITPFGIGAWSDGEIYRAITSGVSRDGHPFFPVMPYPYYNKMDTEDIYSLIAYLRSLDPVENSPKASKADFPVNIIMHTIPEVAHPTPRPDPSDAVAYGAYVVNAAGCVECHTKMEKGKKVGEPFAGGFAFHFPNGAVVRSPNITPDPTGIGAWSKEVFLMKFRQYADSGYVAPPVDWAGGQMQTVMPWTMYSGMSEQDLGAVYDYLRTVAPVGNTVEKWTPPGG